MLEHSFGRFVFPRPKHYSPKGFKDSFWYVHTRSQACKGIITDNSLAGISYDTPAIVERGGLWLDDDEAWESIKYYAGTVALDHEYAASMGLPRGQNFPWDDTKGIYFLNGHHGLHCLVSKPMNS